MAEEVGFKKAEDFIFIFKNDYNRIIFFHFEKIFLKCKWNKINGNWLITSSKDKLIKLHDIRYMKNIFTFKGNTADVTC